MLSFWLAILFLLSCASAVSLGRRHLYDDDDPAMSVPSPPFFPLDSSIPPPPPPPTFAAFPTFPANISALVLPRSPKPHPSSPTLVVPAISAVLAVAIVIGLSLFLYVRWRGKRQKFHYKDSETSASSSSSYEEPRLVTNNFSVAATSSTSEVFYLNAAEETGACFFNSESSPEIRPLPPLPPRGYYEADFNSDEEEEDEDFFSPLASLPASETSSPSREGSSRWVSPARSFSITMSPQNLYSPSPERLRVRKGSSSSLRMFSFWNQNIGFPRISSASTSPDRVTIRTPDAYAPSSVSTSPDGFFRIFLDSSPPIWNDFSRNVKSVLLSSDSISSRRDYVINIGESSSAAPPTRPPPLVPPSQPFVLGNNCSLSSSFKLNKEIADTFFISYQRGLTQETQVLDPRKAQNIATLLQLLRLTTKDVCQALLDGIHLSINTFDSSL